jgi:type VI secretion system secreted protein VgrG
MATTHHAIARRSSIVSLHHVTIVTLLALLALVSMTTSARADVGLGTAASFAVLAGTEVTNTGTTTIFGDIGVSPGTSVIDNGNIVQTGEIYEGETVAAQAKADLLIAYGDAIGRDVTETILVDLTGVDLGPGVYESTDAGAFLLPVDATMTLTGGADDVWIFKSTSGLTFGSNSEILLAGDADPCNVFWVVESTATLGAGSRIVGTIMADTSITMADGATLVGRALARTAEVTLISNTITMEPCVTAVVEDEPAPVVEEQAPVVDEQVTEVPTGAVATGDGTISTMTRGALFLVAAVLALLAIGGTVQVAARRRNRM